jgi:chloramphenicol O-acetyltransferase type A
MKIIQMENWKRKEHFEFFSQFDEPFFGVVAHVDCSIAYDYAKEKGISFFAYYLFQSLQAVNTVEEFKYRIYENQVVLYDKINASSTIGRSDGTFGFGFIEYSRDFKAFNNALEADKERIQSFSGLGLNENVRRVDTVHYTSIPWFHLTGLSHARNYSAKDSVPKISFGKAQKEKDRLMMPVSINCHHGLMDGLHVARYLEIFQTFLNNDK